MELSSGRIKFKLLLQLKKPLKKKSGGSEILKSWPIIFLVNFQNWPNLPDAFEHSIFIEPYTLIFFTKSFSVAASASSKKLASCLSSSGQSNLTTNYSKSALVRATY